MPELPNAHALGAIVLTVLALYFFSRERYPLEVTSLVLLAVLTGAFALFPFEAAGHTLDPVTLFYGFGHEAVIAVCGLLVVGQGLVYTGALEPAGRLLAGAWRVAPRASFAGMLVFVAFVSAFGNNTPIVVLMLPILVSVCLRTHTPASHVLMPMGFATLLGGMGTTIGTSTNLLVVVVAADLGVPRLSMFDFALPAVLAAALGLLYLWLIAPRLLPARQIDLEAASPRLFDARLQLDEKSAAAGRTLAEAMKLADGPMRVTRILRDENWLFPLPDVELKAGDRLRVRDTPANLKRFEEALKATLFSGEAPVSDDNPLASEDQHLAELAVVYGSALDGTNLRDVRFLERHGLAVLALHRAGHDVLRPSEEIHDVVLGPGDVLLVQGPSEEILTLKRNPEFLVLDATMELPRTGKAPIAFAVLLAVVGTAAFGVVPIAVSAMIGAAVLVITRCLGFNAALRAIPPSVLFVVVSSLALGKALVETGATSYVTALFLHATSGASHTIVLSALMLMLAVLTNIVSNNAAAVIGTPIAVGVAQTLGVTPEPFVLAVLFGANMCFATPMAYKTNLLVMSAGNYRFADFVKVGVPLIAILWLSLTFLLDALYL